MKSLYIIAFLVLLEIPYGIMAEPDVVAKVNCQFDKTTMIKKKLSKARECINNGDYSKAKTYINGALKLDANNAEAKRLLKICNSGGTASNSGSSSGSYSNKGSSSGSSSGISSNYSSSAYLNVSNTDLYFSSSGGKEELTISTNRSWSISTNTYSWGHLTMGEGKLTLSIDANYSSSARTDYFVLSAGGVTKKVSISQSGSSAANGVAMYGSVRQFVDNAKGLKELTTAIDGWSACRMGAITESGLGVAVYGGNGYTYTTGINSNLASKLKEINNNRKTIDAVTLTNSGYYCVVYAKNGWYGIVPQSMQTILNQYNNAGEEIYSVSISENGDFVIVSNKHFYASNSVDNTNLKSAKEKYGLIKYVCITNKGLCAVCQNGIYFNNIPGNLENKLKTITFVPDKIVYTDSGTFLITNESGRFGYHM